MGGAGNDLLIDVWRGLSEDNFSGGAGNDVLVVFSRPASEDVVSCGGGFDRVLADRKDVVAPDCEKVFVGLGADEAFRESIPQSFDEGLNPNFFG